MGHTCVTETNTRAQARPIPNVITLLLDLIFLQGQKCVLHASKLTILSLHCMLYFLPAASVERHFKSNKPLPGCMLPGGKGGGPGGGPPAPCGPGVPAVGGMAMFGGIVGGIEPGGGTGGKAPGGGRPAQRQVEFTSYYFMLNEYTKSNC